MTDAQKTIESFLDNIYQNEVAALKENSNDPYVTGWNEAIRYLQAKSYANLYSMARENMTTFAGVALDK